MIVPCNITLYKITSQTLVAILSSPTILFLSYSFSLERINDTPSSAYLIAEPFESCFDVKDKLVFFLTGVAIADGHETVASSRIINCTRRGIHRDACAWYTRVFILRSEMHADRLTYYDGNGVTTGIARRMSFSAGISVSLERATWAHFARLPFNKNVCAY